jgi:uncharacterized membrane protein
MFSAWVRCFGSVLPRHHLLTQRPGTAEAPRRWISIGASVFNTATLMSIENPRITATVRGQPLHMIFVQFPIVCFVGVLLTDLAYWRTDEILWERFSIWLLTAGLIMAFFAIIAGLIDFLFSRRIRAQRPAWFHVLGSIIVIVLSVLNAFVHSRDGYTAVVPEGLALSAIVVLVMIFTNWMGRDIVYRDRVGVPN